MVVYVPAGAFDTKGTILVINREPDLFPEAGETGWRRPIIINVEFQDPEGNPVPGLKFTKPVQICAGLSDDGWKQYTRIRNDFRIQTYNENGGRPKMGRIVSIERSRPASNLRQDHAPVPLCPGNLG